MSPDVCQCSASHSYSKHVHTTLTYIHLYISIEILYHVTAVPIANMHIFYNEMNNQNNTTMSLVAVYFNTCNDNVSHKFLLRGRLMHACQMLRM